MPYANNKGADQPGIRAVISAFVVRCLDSIISLLIRNFKPLASLCSWAGRFESYLVENPERLASLYIHRCGYMDSEETSGKASHLCSSWIAVHGCLRINNRTILRSLVSWHGDNMYILGQSSDRSPKNCDIIFVAEYFGMTFGTLNDDKFRFNDMHRLESGILHAVCACVYT